MSGTIRRLSIAGFKSFRRRAVVPFHPGFTAIIGENGTGKSNIFDALTFVMGRRSRGLRAERMEQLLHAPPSGDPVSEAQVEVTLNPGDVGLGDLVPEATDELVLARKISGSGLTYRLQGRVCPARSVDNVLSALSIEPDGHHIVEQGMVVDVLERSPRRRREILDEVAGVAAYEERKAKAIEELGQVKERLNTSRIILAERRQRLAELHRERQAALEYRSLSEERDRLNATLRWRRWESLSASRDKAQAQRDRAEEEARALEGEVERLDREVEAKERTLSQSSSEADDSGLELVRKVERLRGELSAKEAEARSADRELASLRDTLKELNRWTGGNRRAPEAVDALLKRNQDGILGTVGSLVRPVRDLGSALETALGGHVHDLVVSTRDVALECVDFLKENKLGRARFLPLDKLSSPTISSRARGALGTPGVLGLAVELVECSPEVRPAVAYALTDTVVAESLECVRDLQGVRVVTLNGDLLERGGAIVGGSAQSGRRSPDLREHKARIEKLEGELKRAQAEVHRISGELVSAEAELQQHSAESARSKASRAEEESELGDMRERRKQAYLSLERVRGTLSRRERELAELDGELSALGEVSPPEGGVEEGSPEVLQSRLRQTQRRLEELGAVNLRAIDEYDAFLEEFQLFKERVQTLEREKQEIERFIGEVEAKKKERFFSVMEAVSAELNRLFGQLFGGGEAQLALADPGNIESGLLIRARPPAKEPRLLDALSGGEKTLVAIAFVLSLAAGRPAPFYLLDEVDAALDQANSERLARLLKEFAKEAQVIVISHNEEVVRYADRLYGVTMHKGDSRVVALELVGHE
ncbi:MAG: chromosome segregation SMC family protein [Candidatus Bipolaricaulota bacterium]